MKDNLLFTSAGDNTNFYKMWLNKNKTYDVCICYYGNDVIDKYKNDADIYFKEKGGKFQNFYKIWNENENIRQYKRYFIVDDDIEISTDDINKLFKYLEEYDLWILQPSFDATNPNCRISHDITKQDKTNILRYVNFIEVNTMLFSHYAISKCMQIYDPSLVGYGIDILFLWYLGTEHQDKYAIIDSISCVNPYERPNKSEQREIQKLQPDFMRLLVWKNISRKYRIKPWNHKTYKEIKK